MKQKIEIPFGMNPVDWFNFYGSLKDVFKEETSAHFKSDIEVCLPNPEDLSDQNKPTFVLNSSGNINVMLPCKFKIASGSIISKFMLLSIVRFKNDYRSAMSHIEYEYMNLNIPYCRVGVDYFKIINKKNRNGGTDVILKGWKKDEIKEDHQGKNVFKVMGKYDDFIIVPDNKNYIAVQENCYNLYHKFPHEPHPSPVSLSDIPHTSNFLKHIFQEHFHLSLQYFKVLYDYPMQPLPIIVLVSEDNKTGKSTFINFIKMIFGENAISISPHDLTDTFNDSYATKNLILIDETFFEKKSATDKLKYLTTAQHITVSTKFVQKYSIPFFGKIIMCTNKERDFTQIEEKETRFWVRKVPEISVKKNTNILNDLFDEIPKFLKYLNQMPAVDTKQDRLVFTEQQTHTVFLDHVKEESKVSLHKEIEILIHDFFENNPVDYFLADAKDIKEEWFLKETGTSRNYIRSVLSHKMKLPVSTKTKRYTPFKTADPSMIDKDKSAFPFLFARSPEIITKLLQSNEFIIK